MEQCEGGGVVFEKENIWTFDGKGELLISIMSSLAQEESRSISENVTWGHRKRFAEGRVTMCYGSFLGYRKGEDGTPEIVPEEAEIVRYIFRHFIKGQTPYKIAAELTAQGVPTPGGKQKWTTGTIKSILTNEKYKGDALLQKKFTVDFLTKRRKGTKEKCSSIMWKTVILPSSLQKNSTLCRQNLKNERNVASSTATPVSTQVKSYVVIAENTSEQKSGTPIVNIAV